MQTIKDHHAVIEEMHLAGLPSKLIARTLGLNDGSVANYISAEGIATARRLRNRILAKKIAEKHGVNS